MGKQGSGGGKKGGNLGKAALLLGAAGLFLYIVGVKRRYDAADDFSLDATPRPRGSDDGSKPADSGNAAE
ncbi:MAG TPA: hypothetical protein VFS20_12305 [Longimicrobium sp.]|nr:hypothetical protein [Longimicrobium sp.]